MGKKHFARRVETAAFCKFNAYLPYRIMIFLLATYLYVFGKQGIESWRMVQEKNLNTNHAKSSFDYLYQHTDKEAKKKMIDAWQRSFEDN